jgi:hypothetical protein
MTALLETPFTTTARSTQPRLPSGAQAHWIKCAIGAVDLHLMDDPKQFAKASAWKAFLREPTEILNRKIIDRNAARRKMRRPELAERHVHLFDLRKIGSDSLRKRVVVGAGHVYALFETASRREAVRNNSLSSPDHLSLSVRTLILRKEISSP